MLKSLRERTSGSASVGATAKTERRQAAASAAIHAQTWVSRRPVGRLPRHATWSPRPDNIARRPCLKPLPGLALGHPPDLPLSGCVVNTSLPAGPPPSSWGTTRAVHDYGGIMANRRLIREALFAITLGDRSVFHRI